jgi:hypothetical protein
MGWAEWYRSHVVLPSWAARLSNELGVEETVAWTSPSRARFAQPSQSHEAWAVCPSSQTDRPRFQQLEVEYPLAIPQRLP